jgi:hypothetical protein
MSVIDVNNKEMTSLAVKEMSLEEKYDNLLDSFVLTMATDYALFEELGEVDRYLEMHVQVRKRMLPSLLGSAYKFFKIVSPGRALNQVIQQYAYSQQMYLPKNNIEINWINDRQVACKINNCPNLKRLRNIVKKAGLDIDPRFHCEIELKVLTELAKEFSIEGKTEIEENGCLFIGEIE